MASVERTQLFAGLRVTSFGTLASRVLGMVRDVATAALLGLAGDGVMDAFVVAFRLPNLFRRLFGEGALAASYLPVLTARLERNRRQAWQLASVTLVWLAVILAGVTILAEAGCAIAWRLYGDAPGMKLLLGLSAVMLPYLFFICLAAQVSGTLHALGHFSVPALAPTLLNICWLTAIWLIAPRLTDDKQLQVYVLASAVLVAGTLQLVVQFPVLRQLGFRFDYDWQASRDDVRQIVRSMGPMTLGLAITQINSFFDSLLAWGLAAPADGAESIAWLGDAVSYPLQQGAAAAIYFGERLYQFPLGLLGMTVATVIFPALSRHAARGQHDRLGEDLTLGLRLVLFLGVPAGAGLVLISEPLARLLFKHGEFTADDATRVARMIRCYGVGVWAYCAVPVVVRGYYALGDQKTPLKAGFASMLANLALNAALVWPLAEAGLALSTSLAAMLQTGLLLLLFSRRFGVLGWTDLGRTGAITAASTAAMALVGYAALACIPQTPGWSDEIAGVLVPLALCSAVFAVTSRCLRAPEWELLLSRNPGSAQEDPPDDSELERA